MKIPDWIYKIPLAEKILSNKQLMQFISYVFVGGVATIVEWGMFLLFNSGIRLEYLRSTALAFIYSTLANWILGRVLTFRGEKSGYADIIGVFIVSALGLLFNLLLMKLFVDIIGLIPFLSKVLATIIVFAWNYLTRKLIIYRKKS